MRAHNIIKSHSKWLPMPPFRLLLSSAVQLQCTLNKYLFSHSYIEHIFIYNTKESNFLNSLLCKWQTLSSFLDDAKIIGILIESRLYEILITWTIFIFHALCVNFCFYTEVGSLTALCCLDLKPRQHVFEGQNNSAEIQWSPILHCVFGWHPWHL